jgi:multidrug efflux pump subunit AcrA (membrane-fusion protein)
MIRGKWLLAGGIALFLGIGLGALSLWKRETRKPAPPVAAVNPEPPPGAEVPYTGRIQPVKIESIACPISGVLEEFPVKPGDQVAEGQLIGRIKNDSLEEAEREANLEFERTQSKIAGIESSLISARLEVSRAEADAARGRAELVKVQRIYDRQALLNKEGATPRKTYEASLEAFDQAKAEAAALEDASRRSLERLEEFTKDLELTRKHMVEKQERLDAAKEESRNAEIRSPADGVIVAIAKGAGEPVEKGMPDLIKISTDLTLLEIPLELPPAILKRIQPGSRAVLEMPELPGGGLPAGVREIKDGKAMVEFSSPTPAIRPGMTAIVRLKLL